MESERFSYLYSHQKTLKADQYQTVKDALLQDGADPANLGQKIVLPSSYVGSPRYMAEKTQVCSLIHIFLFLFEGKCDQFVFQANSLSQQNVI